MISGDVGNSYSGFPGEYSFELPYLLSRSPGLRRFVFALPCLVLYDSGNNMACGSWIAKLLRNISKIVATGLGTAPSRSRLRWIGIRYDYAPDRNYCA